MDDREKAVYEPEYDSWRAELRAGLAARLWGAVAPQESSWPRSLCERSLRGRLHGGTGSQFIAEVARTPPVAPNTADGFSLDRSFPDAIRKRHGVYFTPKKLAERMAELLGDRPSVLDLSAGDGALLAAVGRRFPNTRLFAVELDPLLAVACAIRGIVEGFNIEVWSGDGLGVAGPERVDSIVINPPYLGEKGNASVFETLKAEHPHLTEAFAPRTDLANLFLYRALQRIGDDGRLVALTSEYWMQSDAGAPLRNAIADDYDVRQVERFGVGQFRDAPGHHSLITVVERGGQRAFTSIDQGVEATHDAKELGATRWNPFAPMAEKEGTPLGEVAKTSQGFVSGADRLTKRHLRAFEVSGEPGEPIFLFERPPTGVLAERVEPVLRGAQLEPGAVIEEFEPMMWALYIDGELSADDPAVAHLERFRPILARRREARIGSMPWYRMHWPRDRSAMARPKLVTPRRAPSPSFALDLTGSIVSSDCTFVVAPDGVDDEIGFLDRLMWDLNSHDSDRWLRRYGKVKGDLIEFYAGPLEALPIDVGRLFSTG